MRYTQKDDQFIIESLKKGLTFAQIGKRLGRTKSSITRRLARIKKADKSIIIKPAVKKGMEIINDEVVVNWTTKTVITELGEFGTYSCSLDMHGAIMRAYSNEYEGKGDTQAEIAMRYDFAHAKAVAKYMKAHGMTKSMIGQTDLELSVGLTVEEAVYENIQSLKRQIHKKTERKKWIETQKAADMWWSLHHGLLKPFENHIKKHLPTYKVKKLTLASLKKEQRLDLSVLVGISDIHYMKNCFDAYGNNIYDREKAKILIFKHVKVLLRKLLKAHGVPKRFILIIGNDNLHIDNPLQTTTKGTQQANSTDGSYRIELGQYLDITMTLIETFAQVADVEVVSIPGNHDLQTSYFLGESIKRIYEKAKNINVTVRYHERVYLKFGNVCFIVSHGDKVPLRKTEREVHKLIMSEARLQGIKLSSIDEWVFVLGHLHHEYMIDLGGHTELIVMPSFSETDDWHSDMGFVGAKKNSCLYVYDEKLGKQAIIYAGKI